MGQSMLNIVTRDYRTPSLKTLFICYHVRLCQDPYCIVRWLERSLPIVRSPALSKVLAKLAAPWFSMSSECQSIPNMNEPAMLIATRIRQSG